MGAGGACRPKPALMLMHRPQVQRTYHDLLSIEGLVARLATELK